tara:strand:- start:783 stop:911 length:129 start_codon:yes stop_codon:yes gene_type:complete
MGGGYIALTTSLLMFASCIILEIAGKSDYYTKYVKKEVDKPR